MFNKMEYVYTVYKEKSFTKAAEKLFVSQPCLSAAIKKIEEKIGQPLFERRYSNLRPTTIGYEYIKAAEKIMNIHEDFAEKVNSINNIQFGHIKVCGSNYVSSYILPRIISEFSRLYPKIEISLTEASSVEMRKMINNEEVDIMIDSMDDETPDYNCYPLTEEKILLAVPAKFDCNTGLEKYRISPDDLHNPDFDIESIPKISIRHFQNEKFILLKIGNSMYKHATEIFAKSGFTPNVSFRLDQLSTSYSLTASGNGICFVPDKLFKYHHFKDDVFLYNIKDSGRRYLYVTQKQTAFTSNIINKFVEVAKDIIGTQ